MSLIAGALRAGRPGPLDDYWYQAYPFATTTSSGKLVSPERALTCVAVLACVKLIAETLASVPLKIYRKRSDGGKDEVNNHPLRDVLHDQPNRWQSSMEWREMAMGHLLLRGNHYSRIIPGERGAVDQLVPLNPDRMRVVRSSATGEIFYSYNPEGSAERETLLNEEVFHLRGFSSDGLVGFNPIELAREAIGLSLAEEEYGGRMFSNGAQLGGVLEFPGKLTPEARKNIERSLLQRRQGLINAWRPMVLEDGAKWAQISMRARDAEWLESRKFQVAEIARLFRVPPHMISDVSNSTSWGTGIEQQQIGFVVNTMRPWFVRWEQAIRRDLIVAPQYFAEFVRWEQAIGRDLIVAPQYFAEFVIDGLLRGDTKSRYESHGMAIRDGWKTRNEVRLTENMNPLPGLDEPLEQLNTTPAGERGSQRKAGSDDDGPDEQRAMRLRAFVTQVAESLAAKEITAISKAVAKFHGPLLTEWLDEFYAGFTVDISNRLQVPYERANAFVLEAKAEILKSHDLGALLEHSKQNRINKFVEMAQSRNGYTAPLS